MGKKYYYIKNMKTTEEIQEQIRLYGHIEWRSKKNLDDFALNHTFNEDFCIIGFATAKTLQKWVVVTMESTPTYHKHEDVYLVLRKGINRIFYLFGRTPYKEIFFFPIF